MLRSKLIQATSRHEAAIRAHLDEHRQQAEGASEQAREQARERARRMRMTIKAWNLKPGIRLITNTGANRIDSVRLSLEGIVEVTYAIKQISR